MATRKVDERQMARGRFWELAQGAETVLGKLSNPVATFGALAMLAAAGVTVADVLMRWLVSGGVIALNEVMALIFAVAIAACIPGGLSRRVNLKVDLLEGALSPRFAGWLETFGAALLALFFGILAWQIALYAGKLGDQGRTTMILKAPLAPYYYAVAVLFVFGTITQTVITLTTLGRALGRAEYEGGGHPVATAVVAGFMLTIAAVIAWGLVDFSSLSAWIQANTTLAVSLSVLLLWGALLGLVPLSAIVGLMGLGGMAAFIGWAPALSAFSSEATGFLTNSQVATLPLFLMMGSFAAIAGVAEDLYRLAQALVGGFRGGLAMATIGGCGGFGAVTGSSIATAATFGRVALPQMEQRGYAVPLATGTVAAGGTLGALIPPSSPLVLYALLIEASIGQLFIAAIMPALLAVALYFIVVAIYVRAVPNSAPKAQRASIGEIGVALRRSVAVVLLFGTVIGGLYAGIFTATESAAVGAVGAFLIALFRGRLSPKTFFSVMAETTGTTAMIYGLIFGALSFSFFVSVSAVPEMAIAMIQGLDLPPVAVIALLLVVFLALGCIMDSFAVMIITVPIVTPLITGMGYDLIWWGVVNLVVIEMGMITPPFGLNVFVLKSILPKTPLTAIFKGVIPFIAADVIKLALLVAFPMIVLWLPWSMR